MPTHWFLSKRNPKTSWTVPSESSDSKSGSRWQHKIADESAKVHVVGKVIDIDPPRRLVVSWARPADEGNEARTSRVTYDVEPLADSVKLTVTHDEFGTDTEMLESVSFGWPVVISGLKTLLETGKPLPTAPRDGWL